MKILILNFIFVSKKRFFHNTKFACYFIDLPHLLHFLPIDVGIFVVAGRKAGSHSLYGLGFLGNLGAFGGMQHVNENSSSESAHSSSLKKGTSFRDISTSEPLVVLREVDFDDF